MCSLINVLIYFDKTNIHLPELNSYINHMVDIVKDLDPN